MAYRLSAYLCRLEDPCITAGKSTCGSLRRRLHSPHAAVLRPARFTSAVFGSGHLLPTNCYQFTDPGGMDGLVIRENSIQPLRRRPLAEKIIPDFELLLVVH
jgi:hypothetical protein